MQYDFNAPLQIVTQLCHEPLKSQIKVSILVRERGTVTVRERVGIRVKVRGWGKGLSLEKCYVMA